MRSRFRITIDPRLLMACFLSLFFINGIPAQQAVEAWVQRYNHPADADDYAEKVVTDSAGNVLVAGYTHTGITGTDWLVVKYSSSGGPLWTNRFNGLANEHDQATAIAVDGSGNVFVTGYSFDNPTNSGFMTIAYSPAGVPLWTNRYDGPGNLDDQGKAVAVNGSGVVFVTGASVGTNGNADYATIAYSTAGVPLWTNRYDAAGSFDEATGLAVDGSGNVFVTGRSYSAGNSDYATIKYSGAGVPLWTNRYNGAANDTDTPTAITVDLSGNVIVTGTSYAAGSVNPDYATIKYSSAGALLWTRLYNGPANDSDFATALGVDTSDNVFVTGSSMATSSFGSEDIATIKYSSTGGQLWVSRYNGSGNSSDEATALALDGDGNVFVTGSSRTSGNSTDFVTIAYVGPGVALWTNIYSIPGIGLEAATAIAVDLNGQVLVTGHSDSGDVSYDFATIKYSGVGVPAWTNRCNQPGKQSNRPSAVIVDGMGNIIVSGRSSNSGSEDYTTIKYLSSGVPLWTNHFNGNKIDWAYALVADESGNVFVTGSSYTPNGNDDYSTVAYSSAGVPLWTNYYNGPGNFYDAAKAIAVDSSGTVYVTGDSYSIDNINDQDYATIAYSNSGVPLWTNRYDGPGNSYDSARAIAVDGSGTVFVTGVSYATNGATDYATIAYSNSGGPLWTNRYDGPGHGNDSAEDLAVDGSGNVFVTGYSSGSGTADDYATLAYSSTGEALWTNRYSGSGSRNDHPTSIAVGGNGDIFVTGYSRSAASSASEDYLTVAYSHTGVPLWTNRYNGTGNSTDHANTVATDGNGNVFVTGFSYSGNFSESSDFVTIAYSGAGLPLWTNRYNGPANGSDRMETKQALAIAPDGVVVAGFSDGDFASGSVYDYAVVKYLTLFPPVITGQPTNRTIAVTSNALFTATATGTPPPQYQWFFNASPLVGETNAALQLTSVTTNNAGTYSVVVSNSTGVVVSSNATLTVILPAPSSQVTALPAQAGPVLAVSWSGTAGPGGLPPATYSVFVSTNGVDFSAWLTNTTATNASYRGVPGQTYHFYSIAKDTIGQTEAAPVAPDAQTSVPLTAPALAAIGNVIIDPGQLLSFTNSVSAGTPVGEYEFSLDPFIPTGATITVTNGAFKWTPTCSQATTTNWITVRVRDTGAPDLTDTTTFTVAVRECVSPQLGRLVLEAGASGRVPVLLVSSVPLTNLTMQLTLPAGRLTNPSLEIIVPEICDSSVQTLASNVYQLGFAACANQSLVGTQQVAWLYFTAATNQSSGFMELLLDNLTGQQPDGSPVANFAPQSGNVVVVAHEPLLEAASDTGGGIAVTLYGHVGQTNIVQTSTNLALPTAWLFWQQVVFTNLFWEFNLPAPSVTNEALFFRAYRPAE